uniref:toxin-antitoxin system YwqK family antitoxin n=1 Tax=Polaribacter sp. TaxID=1920175 RepID=UPI004047ECCB
MKKKINLITLLNLSIIFLLSSCGQTIDYDTEKEYIKIEYLDGPDILYYKGTPYTGIFIRYIDEEKKQLGLKRTFQDGKENGPFEKYYENGQLSEKGTFKDGEKDGLFEFYDEDGELTKKEIWKEGKIQK